MSNLFTWKTKFILLKYNPVTVRKTGEYLIWVKKKG